MQYWSTLDHSTQVQLGSHLTLLTELEFLTVVTVLILIYKFRIAIAWTEGFQSTVESQSVTREYIDWQEWTSRVDPPPPVDSSIPSLPLVRGILRESLKMMAYGRKEGRTVTERVLLADGSNQQGASVQLVSTGKEDTSTLPQRPTLFPMAWGDGQEQRRWNDKNKK